MKVKAKVKIKLTDYTHSERLHLYDYELVMIISYKMSNTFFLTVLEVTLAELSRNGSEKKKEEFFERCEKLLDPQNYDRLVDMAKSALIGHITKKRKEARMVNKAKELLKACPPSFTIEVDISEQEV